MGKPLAVIIPTFGHLDVALKAVESVYRTVQSPQVLVVDDAGPSDAESVEAMQRFPGLEWHRFDHNKGLTRGWNFGLRWARAQGCKYTVCGNSDILFSAGWFQSLAEAIDDGSDLVGPLTNAPGHQAKQNVRRYIPDYRPSDLPGSIDDVAAELRKKNKRDRLMTKVNGFCMMAKTETWWKHAFDVDNVFNTGSHYRMIRNEDEFQARAGKRGGLVASIVLGAFVFHFRGVSRKGGTRGESGRGYFRPESP